MTEDQQNDLLAVLLGWKKDSYLWTKPSGWTSPKSFQQKACKRPEFTKSLDLCYRAELDLIFIKGLGMVYGKNLQNETTNDSFEHKEVHCERWAFSATPQQRVRAIIKTIGMWENQCAPSTQPTTAG